MKVRDTLMLALKGMGMGMAEVVPGVSGGTIAFITGIYEELINTIKAFDGQAIGLLTKGKWADLWTHINGWFIVQLFLGMFIGVAIGVFGISHLLESQPEILWAFFFGLIIASAIYIGRQVKKWNIAVVGLLLLGAIVAFWVTQVTPTEASANPVYIFICGVIAISALILPGISGSFIMLIMGVYTIILPMVRQLLTSFDLSVIGTLSIFGAGCLVGLLTFSRVMSYMFKNYEDQTLGLLTGFMIGSLFKIWPWRIPTLWIDDTGKRYSDVANSGMTHEAIEELRILSEQNVWPGNYDISDPKVLFVCVSALVGFAVVFLMERVNRD